MSNMQLATMNKVADKVKVNSDVLHSGMKNRIEAKLSSTNIITE
jgi:hypothetical protein